MPPSLGPLPVEVTEPESAKFTAPLVLVHGLWERAAVWRRFAGYLAHRGWRCLAVELSGETFGGDVAARIGALRAALAAADSTPIVVGHDLGAQLASRCADATRALVAIAPLVGAPEALRAAGTWLARRRGAPLRPPRGQWRENYADAEVREPAALIAHILAGALQAPPPSAPVPAAVFASARDPLLDEPLARRFADAIGADFHLLQQPGHAVLNRDGWEGSVAAIHRWIIQRLGVDLLALYDEAWEGREKP